MRLQGEGAVSLRQFRRGMTVAACASGLVVMGILLIATVYLRPDHVKRIAELEARQRSLYQALSSRDELFQNERRNYVKRIKKSDELLRQREETIMLLRSRLAAETERAERTMSSAALLPGVAGGEPVGLTIRSASPEAPPFDPRALTSSR